MTLVALAEVVTRVCPYLANTRHSRRRYVTYKGCFGAGKAAGRFYEGTNQERDPYTEERDAMNTWMTRTEIEAATKEKLHDRKRERIALTPPRRLIDVRAFKVGLAILALLGLPLH